ncbi:type 4b pilus protein PilO2 [Collimonas sp.]|jgi:hypothetical protein|uniref:type 4b pilus protein PilO2 n=1 Tax=Collimonas sp. TaxID=1963772 RepID=UPI002CA66132|nr:type 4b pilus protein PilO2 [Collimonas sp.]HWW05989.1 type 4b pilus protein PilO2 [Collimonas sp.]
MAIYITQLEKHKFVCGLFWQSLSRPRDLAKEAADLAKKIDSDLMVIRMDHSTAQAGFAQTKDGARGILYSLGAVVSKTLALEGAFYDGEQQPVHNWLGAFKLADGKWAYFAVRDANFLPNGDFAGSKEEVLERLHGDYALGGWNVVIGDAELAEQGFHNFNARDIESLIPHKKDGSIRIHKWWRLRQINRNLSWLPMAIGAGVIVLVAVSALMGWQYYQRKKQERENEIAMAAARQKMLLEVSAVARPWSNRAAPPALVRTCLHQFSHITAGGWQLESYSCTPEQLAYAWIRTNSTIALLREQVPDAVIDPGGDKASYSKRLPLAPGVNETLIDNQRLLEPIMSRLQALSVPLRIVKIEPPKPAENTGGWRPEWQSYSFSLNTHGVGPAEIAAVLNRPGVRIDKLTYRGSEWSMEGTIYAK